MRKRAKSKKNLNLKIFAAVNLLLVAGIVVFFLLNKNAIILGKAVAEYEEGKSGIKDYYQKIINLDYEEGVEKEIEFYVFNSEHKSMKVLLSVEGELNNSIEMYEKLVDFFPSEISKKFVYKFKMPEEIRVKPGLHKVWISALEVPNIMPGEEYAGSVLRKVSEVNVYVSYPGKYAEAELDIQNAEQNADSEFNVNIENRGGLIIDKAKTKIEIFTLLGEKIAEIETNANKINIGENTTLSARWKVNSLPGDYIAKFIVFYDEESRNFEKKFIIGAKNLTIEGLMVNNFQLGEIAKLQILVENKWNKELKEAYANLIVYDEDSQIMADIKSSTDSINALSKKELIAYWDTVGVEEGEYSARLSVKYENKSSDKELIFRVSQNSLDIFGIGYVIRPKLIQGETAMNILVILVAVLFLVNIAWFVWWMRVRKK